MTQLRGLEIIVSQWVPAGEIVVMGSGDTPLPDDWAELDEDAKLRWAMRHAVRLVVARDVAERMGTVP